MTTDTEFIYSEQQQQKWSRTIQLCAQLNNENHIY